MLLFVVVVLVGLVSDALRLKGRPELVLAPEGLTLTLRFARPSLGRHDRRQPQAIVWARLPGTATVPGTLDRAGPDWVARFLRATGWPRDRDVLILDPARYGIGQGGCVT